jgi:hypothetical protein
MKKYFITYKNKFSDTVLTAKFNTKKEGKRFLSNNYFQYDFLTDNLY